MKNVVIYAALTASQLEYLTNLGGQNNIDFQIMEVGERAPVVAPPEKPLSNHDLAEVADIIGRPLQEVVAFKERYNIVSVWDALRCYDVPEAAKAYLETVV